MPLPPHILNELKEIENKWLFPVPAKTLLFGKIKSEFVTYWVKYWHDYPYKDYILRNAEGSFFQQINSDKGYYLVFGFERMLRFPANSTRYHPNTYYSGYTKTELEGLSDEVVDELHILVKELEKSQLNLSDPLDIEGQGFTINRKKIFILWVIRRRFRQNLKHK